MTQPLYLAHMPVSTVALARWGASRGWADGAGQRVAFDQGRALHHLLDEMFGQGALRPFRLLAAQRAPVANLYAYTRRSAQALVEAAGLYATPDQQGAANPAALRTKPMPDAFRIGQNIGFDLRLRPVRRLRAALGDSFGPGDEVDAFLHEALRKHGGDRSGMQTAGRTRQAVYVDWLDERLAPAATIDRAKTRLASYRRLPIVRAGHALDGPDAVIQGTLSVTDPLAFATALAGGIGRHTAYGYGMMLLRPPAARAPGA